MQQFREEANTVVVRLGLDGELLDTVRTPAKHFEGSELLGNRYRRSTQCRAVFGA